MALSKFSYARNRIRKAAGLPLSLLLVLLSFGVRRRRNLWLFTARTGFGGGSLALLEATRQLDATTDVVWVTQRDGDREAAEACRIRWVRGGSMQALWYCLRARVVVVTHGFSALWGSAIWGAYVVQLWHGDPLKRIGLDEPSRTPMSGAGRRLLSFFARWFEVYWNSHYDLIVTSSETARCRLITAFGTKKGVVRVLGDPRLDVLVRSPPSVISSRLQTMAGERTVILYAPTWRDDGRLDYLDDLERSLEEVGALLERHHAILWLRLHPHAQGVGEDRLQWRQTVMIVSSEDEPDVNTLLPHVDLLITDYSSIATDFSVLERPIIFIAQDLDDYEGERGFYETYNQYTDEAWFGSWGEALPTLEALLSSPSKRIQWGREHVRQLNNRYHDVAPGQNAERVAQDILSRLRGILNG